MSLFKCPECDIYIKNKNETNKIFSVIKLVMGIIYMAISFIIFYQILNMNSNNTLSDYTTILIIKSLLCIVCTIFAGNINIFNRNSESKFSFAFTGILYGMASLFMRNTESIFKFIPVIISILFCFCVINWYIVIHSASKRIKIFLSILIIYFFATALFLN